MCLEEKCDDGDPCKFIIRSKDPLKPNLAYVCQASSKEDRDEWTSEINRIMKMQHDFLARLQHPLDFQKKGKEV